MPLLTNTYYDLVGTVFADFDAKMCQALQADPFFNTGSLLPDHRYYRMIYFSDNFIQGFQQGRVIEEQFLFEYLLQRTFLASGTEFNQSQLNQFGISESGSLKNAFGRAFQQTQASALVKLVTYSVGDGRSLGWSAPTDKNAKMLILTIVGEGSLTFAPYYNIETGETDLNPNYYG